MCKNRFLPFCGHAACVLTLWVGHPYCSVVQAATPEMAGQVTQTSRYKVTGTIIDDMGEPLPGASVRIKGTDTGAISGMDGTFEIPVNGTGKVTLVISYIGMESIERQAVPGKKLNIRMAQEERIMNELIVTGFQTISRERATGSAVIINSEDLNQVQAPDLVAKLEGIAPGLSTYNNEPSIRGVSSFAVGTTPLLVVDGQPSSLTLEDLNPETVETITVLKDAAATSLYGVRASNGVIVVTTKQAENDKLNVNVSLGYYLKPLPSLDYMHYASTSDIIDLERDNLLSDPEYIKSPTAYFSTMTAKSSPAYMTQVDMLYYRMAMGEITQEEVNAGLDRLRGNDYRREYRKKLQHLNLTQDYNVTLSKGGGKNDLFFSARYQELGQYNRYDEARNISLYLKNTLSVASWMKLTLGMDTRFNRSEFCQASGMGYTSAMPYDRLYDDDGQPVNRYIYNQVLAEQLATQDGYYDMGFNAAEESKHNIKKTDRQYLKLFLHTDFNITKDLDLELKFQYERNHAETNEYDEENSYMMRSILNEFASRNDDGTLTYHIPRGGHLLTGNTNASYYNLRGQFNYKKEFAGKHDVSALLGGEIRQDKNRSASSERYGYDDMRLTYSMVDWATLSKDGVEGGLYSALRRRSEVLNVYEEMHRYVSAYFNAGYTYDTRYSLNGSVRVEQADLFGTDPKYRYRPLWSVGASWNVTNERFVKDAGMDWLDMFKLRLTYGITGNVDQTSSPYLLAYYLTSLYTNSPITTLQTPPNSSLRWEKTSTLNFGMDFMLLGRLTGSFDVYRRYSSDLLVNKSIDPSLGFDGKARANNGEMQNNGVELSLSYDWLKKRDMSFTTSFSAAYNKNEIKKVDYEPTDALDMMREPTSNYKMGDTYNSLYAYRYAGLTATGDPSVYDENGNVISIEQVRNVNAVVCVGQLTPKWNGALQLDFRWKGLNVFAKVVYYTGHALRDDVVTLYDPYNAIEGGAIHEDISRRWTPEHTDTDIPAMGLHTNVGERNYHWKYADVNTESASFIKLRNIGVSYTLPQGLVSKLKMKGITVKVQVDNLCYWAANKRDIDPEAFNANTGTRTDAIMPSYVLGLNVKF